MVQSFHLPVLGLNLVIDKRIVQKNIKQFKLLKTEYGEWSHRTIASQKHKPRDPSYLNLKVTAPGARLEI